MTAGSPVSPATASTHGAARDVLSDEDPNDPLIAEQRRKRQRQSEEQYGEARERAAKLVHGETVDHVLRGTGRAFVAPQYLLQPALLVLGAGVGIGGAAIAVAGSLVSAIAEARVAWQFRAMRAAIKMSPTAAADRLVYELHRAEQLIAWVRHTRSRLPVGRRLDQRRATRAMHRAMDRAIDGLGDPETDATARVVLGRAVALSKELHERDLLDLRAVRRHCNQLFVLAQSRHDTAIADVLFHEVAITGDASLERLRDELGRPHDFLPLRTKIALAVAQRRERRRVERAERESRYRGSTSPKARGTEVLRKALPKWLQGERSYVRRVLHEARRVQTLADAEGQILKHLRVTQGAINEVRPAVEVPAAVAAAVRVAEMGAMRFRLGDRSVKHHELVDDARRVAFLAGVTSGVPASVLEANEARMAAVGVDPAELRHPVPTVPARRDPNLGTPASEARLAEIFDGAKSVADRAAGIVPSGRD